MTSSDQWQPRANPWVIAVVVAMAAFMEVLDTSIANVSLPHMAGSLGASYDQSTWVLTSYLVSNAIVLPMTGWLAGALGRKRFFLGCLAVFTISSLLCGLAPSLASMIAFRVLQGAGGGGLQPMAQAILADTFPPRQRGLAFAVFAVTTIVAPTVGPTLGGWITDNYSWPWIFYINVPLGLLAGFMGGLTDSVIGRAVACIARKTASQNSRIRPRSCRASPGSRARAHPSATRSAEGLSACWISRAGPANLIRCSSRWPRRRLTRSRTGCAPWPARPADTPAR